MPSITDCESFSLLGLGDKRGKIVPPIQKPTGRWLVLKANAEIMCYKYQNNKVIIFELKPVKYENSEKNNLGRV